MVVNRKEVVMEQKSKKEGGGKTKAPAEEAPTEEAPAE